jgi:acetylornithine/N-succinyldiaminopimelate aminotransferase
MLSQRQLFLQHVAQTSEMPANLEIVSAKGVYMYEPSGKAYLDLISGNCVSNLGHCHPEVVKAVQNQCAKYMHTQVYGEFILTPQVELAKLLAANLPNSLNSVYFVNSGTEAVEGAMKLAKRYTKRAKIVAARGAYHGSSQGALSLMSSEFFTAAFRPLLPQVFFIDFNDENNLNQVDFETACVVVEPVRAEIGVQKPEKDYLKKLRKRCDEVGALLIFDEIQVGCGRTGSLWAFQQYETVPDILLLAKGLGGGMPIGAFIADKKIMDSFAKNPVLGHITTFGGHPVSCAAALATLKILVEQPEIIANVQRKADIFIKLLRHKAIKEVRNAGLIMAVQLENFEMVKNTIRFCLELGLVTDWFLYNETSIRVAPPLIIDDSEIEKACNILLTALDLALKN